MAAVIGLAVSAIIGGLSAGSSQRAAKSARKREQHLIRLQTAEEIRRRTGKFEQEKSEAIAIAGASGFARGKADEGVAASGGFGQVLKDMQTEFGLEVDWLRRSAEAGVDATGQAYKAASTKIGYDYASSLASGFNAYGQSQNWWATPTTAAPTTYRI